MALCKPSLLANVSGKLSGCEFAITRNGCVLKHQKPPRQFSTLHAEQSRAAWNHRASLWHTLDVDEVRAWEVWAANHPTTNRLGETIYLNAYQSFMSQLLDTTNTFSIPDVTYPPQGITEAFWSFQAFIYQGGPYRVDFYTNYYPSYFLAITLWVAPWLPKNSSRAPYRWLNIGTYNHITSDYNWYTRFQERGLELQTGQRIALKGRKHYYGNLPSHSPILYYTVL